jgi:broad specificity phosphatase PhoE
MGTRVILLEAGPTPWDTEGRLVGRRPLPLVAEAIDAIRRLVDSLPFEIHSIYRAKANEACDQTARLIAERFSLRLRGNSDLDEVGLGLWEGLTPEELQFRFPTVFPQWQTNPLGVNPPDGEPLDSAIQRIGTAVRAILRRNRGFNAALALRPLSLQIAAGVLRDEPPTAIAFHLHQRQPMTTIELE